MTSLRFHIGNVKHQYSYDLERDLYIIGSAQITSTGVLNMEFHEVPCRAFVRILALRNIQLYRCHDEHADDLFRAVVEVALHIGEPFPGGLIEARNKYLFDRV